MKSWMVSDKSELSPLLLSFIAGAASSTLIWWTLSRGRGESDDDDAWTMDRATWVEDIKSRIGELPSKRMRWPWDRQRKRVSSLSTNEEQEETFAPPPSPPPLSPKDKTGLCIGSIFGLDVGGTLAKLVYFEQRQNEYQTNGSHRDQVHHRAASAKVVLQARRGLQRRNTTTGRLHTVDSEQDLKPMYLVRQESLPDDLSECEDLFVAPEFSTQESLEMSWHADDKSHRKCEENDNRGMKKSRSMLDISKSRDHAEALDRFYNFARRLDTYETAVKDKNLSFYSRELGGDFHFIRFESSRMDNAMHLIRVNNFHRNIKTMGATGGGAHKYAPDWERVLGIKMEKQDELDSLVAGMQFVMSTAIGECYTYVATQDHEETASSSSRATNEVDAGLRYDEGSDEPSDADDSSTQAYQGVEWSWTRKVQRDVASDSSSYPYLLVTIGTGVSVLRVDGPRKHERISGSTIGGGTYWGLMKLLTDVETFEDAMKLAERGDPSKVDMMVGDIYGKHSDALEKVGLPANLVASSFGKLVTKADPAKDLKQEDLARALLLMVTNNIGQVAYLNAKLSNTPRIYFVGNFLRQNHVSQHRLSYAIDYWSKGEMAALFLEHEGYFGALGAFLLSQGISRGQTGSFLWEGRTDLRSGTETVEAAYKYGRHRRSRTMSSVH